MRDPKRIDPIMEKLTELWKLHPDWRLCQLLFNVAVSTGWKESDLFHFEDDELLKKLICKEGKTTATCKTRHPSPSGDSGKLLSTLHKNKKMYSDD